MRHLQPVKLSKQASMPMSSFVHSHGQSYVQVARRCEASRCVGSQAEASVDMAQFCGYL